MQRGERLVGRFLPQFSSSVVVLSRRAFAAILAPLLHPMRMSAVAVRCTLAWLATAASVYARMLSDPALTVFVNASGGADTLGCGTSASPCLTLRYAVDVVANPLTPADAFATVVVSAGNFAQDSCGGKAVRPLIVRGSSMSSTAFDCGGAGPLLSSEASVFAAGFTVQHSAVVNSTVGGGAISVSMPVDGGTVILRDIAFLNSTSQYSDGGAVAVLCGNNSASDPAPSCTNAYVAIEDCVFNYNVATMPPGSYFSPGTRARQPRFCDFA